MRNILIFALGLFIVACSSKSEDVKDMNDIIPRSDKDYDKKDSIPSDNSDTLKLYQELFSKVDLKLDSISVYDEDLFPDRVGPDKMEKYRMVFGDEVVILSKWKFSDSLRVSSALFNWADCFGEKCKSIRIGEEKNLQRNAFQILTNDTVLLYLESSKKIDLKKWDSYLENLGYELNWKYRLEQSNGGKVRWFNYIDEKKTPLKKP